MPNELRDKLLGAALNHVPFDGWSGATLLTAANEIGVSEADARAAFPRGAVEMAAAFHTRGDDAMVARMCGKEFEALRYSEKVAAAVRYRLEVVEDKELVRRGTTLFSLPLNATEGARLIWGTADRIWVALGDTSDDINWYSKRTILSGVYGSSVLFWLGDKSEGHAASWAFVDRRIANVMQFEKLKAKVQKNKVLSGLFAIPNSFLSGIKAPSNLVRDDLPGRWTPNQENP